MPTGEGGQADPVPEVLEIADRVRAVARGQDEAVHTSEPGPAVLGVTTHPVRGACRAGRQVTTALRSAAEHARATNEILSRIGA